MILNYRFGYWFVICLGLCSFHGNSAFGQLHCLNYTSQDGLPSDLITCANEDQDGFMWFGSSNGICKFDGFSFDNYSFLDPENSPGGNFITAIEIDQNNDLWVGTQNDGLFHLSRKENIWEHFATSKSAYHQMRGNEIFFIHADQNGTIWYGSDKSGLGCINPKAQSHENFDLDTLPRRDTWVNRAYGAVEDEDDPNLIHLVGQGYLYHFNKTTKRFTAPEVTLEPIAHEDFVFDPRTLVQISATKFLIGCLASGVKSFNTETGEFLDFYPREIDYSSGWKTHVFEGAENEVWIADRIEGIVRVDRDSRNLNLFRPEAFNRKGLLKGLYNSIYHSSMGHTWVMTSKGVSLIVPQYQAFQYFGTKIDGPNVFMDIDTIPNSDNFLGSFGGENARVKVLDENMKVLSIADVPNSPELILLVYKSEFFQGEFLCLTDRLYRLDLKKGTLSPKPIKGLPDDVKLADFVAVNDQELWLLLSSGSLLRYNSSEKSSDLFPFAGYESSFEHKILYHGMSKVGDQIWIATHEELIVFNPSNGHSSYLYFENNELKRRGPLEGIKSPKGSVKQVIPIDKDCAWVMTSEEGIYKICASMIDSFVLQEHRDKRNLSQLLGPIEMISGQSNDYWLATKNGLVHADGNLEEFRVFNQPEGLRASLLKSGLSRIGDYLYIGLPKGFTRVNTKDLLKEKVEGKIQIIKSTIDGVSIDERENRQFDHEENNFLVAVATPNYHEARHVTIAHRLVNHSDEWEYSEPGEKTFRYNKLLPGNYTFEVKSKSPSTKWSSVESEHFVIVAPFWNRNWFRILTTLFVLALFYLFYHWNLKRKLNEEKLKTEMAELEGQALRAQMNPHFIFNSLNSIKSLVLLDRKKEGITYLTKFSRMVREILSLSKEKQISLQKELELLGMYLDMESLRFQGKFEYKINVNSEVNTYQVMVPPLLIQPFVENSIWHGLLHKEGDAKLEIDIWDNGKTLHVTVKDNGIGRKAAKQIKSKKSLYNKTSEGLSLSLNRMNLISEHAEIKIEDLYDEEKSSGTLVTLKIPLQYE